MPFNTNGRNAMLTGGLGDTITHISVHDAIPDATGSDEVSGGTYARQAVTWAAAASGVRDNTALISHDIPAGSTAVAYGFFDALSGGGHYGHALVGSSLSGFATVDSAGVTSNAIQSAGHGLSNSDRIAVYSVHAESLPAGLTEQTLYWVVGSATNTFQVALTESGTAVDITGQGELWWQDCVPEAFNAGGQLRAAAGDMDLNANVI